MPDQWPGRRYPPGKPHDVLPYAVAEVVAVGMTPVQALASATSAAAACGLAGVTGRLRSRPSADLLMIAGVPTVDMRWAVAGG